MELAIPWQSIEEYVDFRLKGRGITFKELEGINFVTFPKNYERYQKGQFEFKTPSKKVELYSTLLEKFGFDPLPHPMAPPETTAEFPLILMGGRKSLEYVHSAGRQIRLLRKRVPDPTIEMSPKLLREKGSWMGIGCGWKRSIFEIKNASDLGRNLLKGFQNRWSPWSTVGGFQRERIPSMVGSSRM